MKFLTFIDLHQDKKVLKELLDDARRDDVEFIVCAGDISSFGSGLTYVLKKLNSVGKDVYIIAGNHEEGIDMDQQLKKFPNCHSFDRGAVEIGDYVFLGFGGGGFAQQDPEFRKVARGWYGKYKDRKIVLVTHGPPYGTKLDKLDKRHVGNKDYRKFIERIKPRLAISGHIHETAGAIDKIGKTRLINPGWEGMVVELK